MKILITDNDLGDGALEINLLKQYLNAEVLIAQCKSEDDVIKSLSEFNPDAVIVQWAPVKAKAISLMSNVKIISRIGIGMDMIDLEAAAQAGIPVKNVPHYCTEEVATHALSLALSLWRKLPQLDAEMRSGKWAAASHANTIKQLSKSTIGLIGTGRIGSLVGKYFTGVGAKVIAFDPYASGHGFESVELAKISAESDLISLHCPLTSENKHLINDQFLASTSKKPILINTSRGGLIDPAAVDRALKSGVLAGAGLDVYEVEPLPMDDILRSSPNTILTPHSSWCSVQALPELRKEAVMNIVNFYKDSAK
ncbi:SerA Phosphoglycerate dehydrogenase and related dehydrogenases [Candidatus Planktophila versatilis]|uniref:C-terminal binding protein n=1 Tax=Candidatus Planktophila versatilis TaxID=1884905 RepID=UPI003BEEDE36